MARDISIAISAKDNFTSAITTMQNANRNFNKDIDGLQQKLNALNRTKVTLKMDADDLKRALKDAEKQYNATGDAADRLKKEIAQANYDRAKQNLDLVSKSAKQAEKDMLNLTGAMSKAENRAGISGGSSINSSGKNGTGNILSSLATSGAIQMVGSTLSKGFNTYINSAFGEAAGNVAGGALSGAASGAAIGSLFGPAGTAIGAVAGGLLGAVEGEMQNYEKKEDAYKSSVQETYSTVQQNYADDTQSGSALAAQREKDQISFATLLKSDKKAESYLGDVLDLANTTPFLYDDLTSMSKTLLTYGYQQKNMISTLTAIGDAGAALGMGTDGMNMVATGLGRMRSSGKASLEYLNLLQERGIDAIGALADAYGTSNKDIYDKISKGKIDGAKASRIIEEYLQETYGGSMEKQSETYEGKLSTLQGMEENMQAKRGEGYNEIRKEGIQSQIDWYESDDGKVAQEAQKYIGEYEASIENAKAQAQQDAISQMLKTQEWKEAEATDDGAKMGLLYKQAMVEGMNAYNSTPEAQEAMELDLKLADFTQTSTAAHDTVYENAYTLTNKFTEGIEDGKWGIKQAVDDAMLLISGSYRANVTLTTNVTKSNQGITPLPSTGASLYNPLQNTNSGANKSAPTVDPGISLPKITPNTHATGLFRVPYDGYTAALHEGETVVTGSASSEKDRTGGWGGTVNITGNSFTVREEADIDKIASALVSRMKQAAMTS